jgi:hypothetical protein
MKYYRKANPNAYKNVRKCTIWNYSFSILLEMIIIIGKRIKQRFWSSRRSYLTYPERFSNGGSTDVFEKKSGSAFRVVFLLVRL